MLRATTVLSHWAAFPFWAVALIASSIQAAEDSDAKLTADADFPGGNIVIERIEADRIDVRQDLRDTAGDWFYWYFRVCGAAGRTVTVHFTQGNVIGVRGPAVSVDRGSTWCWLGAEACDGSSFRYSVPPDAAEVRFAFGIPYLESHLAKFIERHRDNPALRTETLCRTSKGRNVELLRIGPSDREPDHRVLLTARHHACEAMADYVLEGLLELVLSDERDGGWLRSHVEFLAVPFMDKDGVEDGDQGKNRKPHDHNRDYVQKIHSSVKALTAFVPTWSCDKWRVAIDLHCPHIRGEHNEVIYFVAGSDPQNWEQVTQFSGILERLAKGPLTYRRRDNLPFGKAWNTGSSDLSLKSFSGWANEQPGVKLASTIEFPYANVSGEAVGEEAARAFGADVARSLRVYLDN